MVYSNVIRLPFRLLPFGTGTPKDSVGAEDDDSCEYNEGGKDRCMPQKRVGADDCEYDQGGRDWYMPQDRLGAEDDESCEYN